MKRRAVAVGCWLLGCTATTELDELGSGATATSSSAVSSSASSATGGSGGGSGGNSGACDYAERVLADTPIAYWRLEELATPTAYDATSNHYDGVYVSGVTLGVPGPFAQAGTAVHFDGTGRIDFGDRFDFAGTHAFSIEAWIHPDAGAEGALCGKLDYVDTEYSGYIIYIGDAGNLAFSRRPGGLAAVRSLRAGAFLHVVATYDGFTMRLYLDGEVQDNEEQTTPIADVAAPFAVGSATNWSNIEGTIDEVALYDHALTSTQIADHHACAMESR